MTRAVNIFHFHMIMQHLTICFGCLYNVKINKLPLPSTVAVKLATETRRRTLNDLTLGE